MSTLVVARKEFADAVRSRTLWGIVAIIATMTSIGMGVSAFVPGGTTVYAAIGGAAQFAGILVPIMALVAAYLSIAGERESGSIKVLLGLPPSRGAVLAGKFVGRSLVVVVGIVAGFAVAGLVSLVVYDAVPLVAFASVTLLSASLGVAFVGIAVGISAATSTRARAMTGSIATYLVFVLLWDLLPQGLYFLLHGQPPADTVPGWFLGLQALSPPGAYSGLIAAALAGPGWAARLSGPRPVYLEPWFLGALLVAWTLLPLLAGYRRFERADL